MNVILYSRVSTQDQTCEVQLMELRSFAAGKEWAVAKEFTDVISGSKADRVGLDEVMAMVRSKAVDAVLAVKIDRMARSLGHFAHLTAEFIKYDVALILTSQGIDTSKSNPCGRLQANVLAAFAEFERDLIRERTRAGLVAARARGAILGRPSKKMVPVPERAAIVAAWRAAGAEDYRELGVRLGGVSGSTAWRLARKLAVKPPAPVDENASIKKSPVALDIDLA